MHFYRIFVFFYIMAHELTHRIYDFLKEFPPFHFLSKEEILHLASQSTVKYLQKEDILTLDNGLYKLRITRNYRAYGPNTILLDNALATMGA